MVSDKKPLGMSDLWRGGRRRVFALAAVSSLAAMGIGSPPSTAKKRDKAKKKQKAGGNGGDVVKVAQKYKGAKYTWGGASPKGFDCSGFTWYCYQKATGMDISRVVKDQWKQGKSVGRGDLDEGDLVFFRNTAERGLSHVGISLGGDKFIHAENEDTGVVISSLDSDYYNDHYAGARRLL